MSKAIKMIWSGERTGKTSTAPSLRERRPESSPSSHHRHPGRDVDDVALGRKLHEALDDPLYRRTPIQTELPKIGEGNTFRSKRPRTAMSSARE